MILTISGSGNGLSGGYDKFDSLDITIRFNESATIVVENIALFSLIPRESYVMLDPRGAELSL